MSANRYVMSGLLVVVGMLSILGNCVNASSVYNSDLPAINVFVEEVIPHLVRPGDNITVVVRVSNIGGETAEIEEMKIKLPKGMELIGVENGIDDNSASLCASCSREIKYYIHVSTDLPTAKYPIKFDVYHADMVTHYTYYIDVYGIPDIILQSSSSITLSPGSHYTYSLVLKNVGTGKADKVNVYINSQKFYIKGSNNIYLSSMDVDSTKSTSITIYSSKDVVPDNYFLPVKVEYEDMDHVRYSKEFYIAVNVVSNATLDISSISLDPNPPLLNEDGQLIVRVENLGEGKVKNVSVSLEGDTDIFYYTSAYIGELDEEEDTAAIFTYHIALPKTYKVGIVIRYSDDLGDHVVKYPYSFNVKYPQSRMMYLIIAIVVVVVVGVGYYYYKRKKKK